MNHLYFIFKNYSMLFYNSIFHCTLKKELQETNFFTYIFKILYSYSTLNWRILNSSFKKIVGKEQIKSNMAENVEKQTA